MYKVCRWAGWTRRLFRACVSRKPILSTRGTSLRKSLHLKPSFGGEGVERDIQSLPVGGLNPQTISRFGFPQTHPFSTRHSFEKKPSFKIRFLQKKYDLSAPELFWRRRSRAGKDIIAGGNDVPASVPRRFVRAFGDEQIGFYAEKSTMRLHRAFLAEKEGLTPLPLT